MKKEIGGTYWLRRIRVPAGLPTIQTNLSIVFFLTLHAGVVVAVVVATVPPRQLQQLQNSKPNQQGDHMRS